MMGMKKRKKLQNEWFNRYILDLPFTCNQRDTSLWFAPTEIVFDTTDCPNNTHSRPLIFSLVEKPILRCNFILHIYNSFKSNRSEKIPFAKDWTPPLSSFTCTFAQKALDRLAGHVVEICCEEQSSMDAVLAHWKHCKLSTF